MCDRMQSSTWERRILLWQNAVKNAEQESDVPLDDCLLSTPVFALCVDPSWSLLQCLTPMFPLKTMGWKMTMSPAPSDYVETSTSDIRLCRSCILCFKLLDIVFRRVICQCKGLVRCYEHVCKWQVGHNALGGGKITDQGSVLVDNAIKSGDIFSHDCWQELEPDAKAHTLHLIGLLSDGGVHSRLDQLIPLMDGVSPLSNSTPNWNCCNCLRRVYTMCSLNLLGLYSGAHSTMCCRLLQISENQEDCKKLVQVTVSGAHKRHGWEHLSNSATLQAVEHGVKRIRLHLLTDGRDCTDGSSVKLMQQVLDECKKLSEKGCDAQVASGGGRMKVTMDRYEVTFFCEHVVYCIANH